MKKILLLLPFFLWACGGGGGSTEPEPPQLPTVTNIEVTTSEDTPKNFFLGGSEPNNLELTYSLSTQPQHGSISISLGAATYTPNANYNGQDVFAYLASSTAGNSNIGTIVVTITPVDDEPISKDIMVSTDEDTPVDITLEVDEFDGDNVNFNIIENPHSGTVSINGNIATYTPDGNWFGSDYFTFEAVDSNSKIIMNIATVTIIVNSVRDPIYLPGEYGNSIKETDDGGFIIGGTDNSSSILIKTDSEGNFLWKKNYDFSDILDIEIDYDGGYIFTGYTENKNILVKTDSSGNIIWSKTYNFSELTRANSLTKTNDNGYVIVGDFAPYSWGTTGIASGGFAAFVVKTDSQGNEIWSNTYSIENSENFNTLGAYFVEQTNEGGYIVGGPATFQENNYFKIDSNGNLEWYKVFGNSDVKHFSSIDLTLDGGFIFLGTTDENLANYDDGNYSDVTIYKTDSEGNQEWSRVFDSERYDYAWRGIHQTPDGGYIFISRTSSYIYKVNSEGEEEWRNEGLEGFTGGSMNALDMIIAQDNNFIIIGYKVNGEITIFKISEQGNQLF